MKNIVYQPKQVRLFLALLLALMIALAFKFTRHSPGQSRILIMGIEVIVIGVLMAIPRTFFPLFKLILIGSSYLGNFIFALISIVVFSLILTPIALVMRLSGKKFMSTRIDVALSTYYDEAEERQDIRKQY
ncbi:hypothetical protein D4R89_00355 [bacterium]|nr:MAG: hypothetical protein D4R89_00355 [bacterium]